MWWRLPRGCAPPTRDRSRGRHPFAAAFFALVAGRATRLARFAAGWMKPYEGVIGLGTTTATADASADGVATAEGWRPPARVRAEGAPSLRSRHHIARGVVRRRR